MGNAELVLAEIARRPGASDGELRIATGVESHQQVNQICRRLAAEGRIVRQARPDGRIGNHLRDEMAPARPSRGEPPGAVARSAAGPPTRSRWRRRTGRRLPAPSAPAFPPAHSAVIVVPCSKAKRSGGVAGHRPAGLAGRLSDGTAAALTAQRAAGAEAADLDETRLLPAVARYDGHLYRVAGAALRQAAIDGQPIIVMSGFYGVLDALDPIGTYEQRMHAASWPKGLLEDALVEAVLRHGRRDVVVFCSQSTDYATVVRRVGWRRAGLRCWLAAPDAGGRGGAQRSVPVATGEAIVAYLDDMLDGSWTSSDGLGLTTEVLT